MDRDAMRAVSSALFNNDKLIEVVIVIDQWDRPMFTTQEVASRLGISHDLVRKVLKRLEAVDLIKARERLGGARGALPFELQRGPTWDALASLVEALN